tara:strand:+ start:2433 stop:7157 length:4725 start_codon:yes stop_codon:yes gene_type:complete
MQNSERAHYDKFVTRTLDEVQVGLKLDNHGNGSLKRRVHDALERRTNDGTERCAAQKVIEGRFILGGDDASYLASGLAVLWSTVGHGAPSGEVELSLAPAALYSPDAVNGIRRGLLAALEKRNKEMRDEAPNLIGGLMRALLMLLPFVYKWEPEQPVSDEQKEMRRFLMKGQVKTVEQRNTLFAFLVRARGAIDSAGDGQIPSSRLASQIVDACLSVNRAAYQAVLAKYKKLLDDANARLEAEIANEKALSAERAARIKKVRETYEAKMEKKQAELAALRNEMSALQAGMDLMQQSCEEKDEDILDLMGKLADCEDAIEALNVELDTQSELHQLRKIEWEAQQKAHLEKVASLEAQHEETKQLLATEKQKTSEQLEHVAGMQAAVKQLKTLKTQVDAKGQELLDRITALQAEVKDAKKDASAKEAVLQRERKVRKELATKLERVTKERGECKNNLTTARLRLQRCERAREALKKLHAKLLVRKGELESELAATNTANTETCNVLQLRLAQCEEDLAACREENAALEAKRSTTEAELTKRVEACEAELEAKKAELAALLGKVDQHKERLKAHRVEQTALTNRLRESIDVLKRELAVLEQEKADADAEVRKCQEQCEADKAALRKQVQDGTEQLATAKEKIATLESNIADLSAQAVSATNALAKAKTALAQAENQLAECTAREEGRAATFEANLSTMQKALADADAATKAAQQAADDARVCRKDLEFTTKRLKAMKDAMHKASDEEKKEIDDMREQLQEELEEVKEKKQQAETTLAFLRSDLAMANEPGSGSTSGDVVELNTRIEMAEKIVATSNRLIAVFEKQLADLETGGPDYTPFTAPVVGPKEDASASRDAWVDVAIMRGLVGQRGPTEPASVGTCAADALLPYALPNIDDAVKYLLPAHMLLKSTPDPTNDEVVAATAACAACEHAASDNGAKRQRLSQRAADLASPAVASEALALFGDDFAIIGETPAASLPPERCGVEMPHEVRWMPQGPRGGAMARVAVLEHAIARCKQISAQPDVHPSVADALRQAATALKLQQLEPLYDLQEAADFDDDPHPLGTGATRLVTRPCAIVRGTLSLPVGAGVAPLAGRRDAASFTQDAALSQAMDKTATATSKLRNSLRRQGLPSNVYVAPRPSELAFQSAPTGALEGDADGGTPPPTQTSERINGAMYREETFLRIINRLIVAAAALDLSGGDNDGNNTATIDPVAAFLDASKSEQDGAGVANPQTRREGLWAEMQRHVAISQDRLWVFVRLLSGKIGGNVSEVITLADEATLKAAKAIQEQRLEISKRVSDMQSKIVETVVASMLKNSQMTMEYIQKDKSLAVIDAEARKNLKDLSTGASGRPFFEANVALKNLTEKDKATPPLKDVLSGLANVGMQMQTTLEQTLADPSAASASLVELSHPSNSYFVSMRSDALAAIRTAQEKLNCELGAVGARRRLMLWELIEGGCAPLVDRFAELCGYLLVQSRTATGVSAMYVSHQNIYTNASQARVALAKLVAAALTYLDRVPAPSFEREDTKEARFEVLTQGERVRDIDITARRLPLPRAPLFAPMSESGYVVVGGRRRT